MTALSLPQWLADRRALSGAARRYLAARARGSSDRHLAVLMDAWGARVQAALAAGLTPTEVGSLAGLIDPPAVLGISDVEDGLAHRLDRGQVAS